MASKKKPVKRPKRRTVAVEYVEQEQLWKQSNPLDKKKKFETPKAMLEAACSYFNFIDKNPFYRAEAKVVEGQIENASVPVMRAYTWDGLCIFLGIGEAYFREFRRKTIEHSDPDYVTVIEWIGKVIKNQKFTGAASGFFNAQIISRDLGLVDKVDNINRNYNSVELSKVEIKKLSNELEEEN